MAHKRHFSNAETKQFVRIHNIMHYEDNAPSSSESEPESKANGPTPDNIHSVNDIQDIEQTVNRFTLSHTSVHPVRHPSYSRLSIPSSDPSPQPQQPHDSAPKDFYDYIESSVMKYINHSNSQIDDGDTPISQTMVQKTLIKLKVLLLIPESDAIIKLDDGSKVKQRLHKKPHSDIENQRGIGYNYNHQDEETVTNAIISGNWCTQSTRSRYGVYLPSAALLHHPSYSIDVERYCGILRGSVRQDWNTIESDDDEVRNWEELKPSWFELFFDLMFVAAIIHISSEVAYAYGKYEYIFVMTVFPQFGLLILCWLEQVLYFSRFRMNQSGDGFLRFVYMALVLMMGLSIGDLSNQLYQKLFLSSYMCTKLIMMIMFVKSSLIIRARNHSIFMIVENVISIITVLFIEILVNVPETEQDVWPLIYSCLFIYSWCHKTVILYTKPIRDLGVNIPINVPHVAERMGAFVLIILGETIISIMVQHINATREGIITAYTVTMAFFIIVYCIGKLYFESQPTEYELHHHQKVHAMSTSVWRAKIYKWFHILLFFALLGLGLGTKLTVYELAHYHHDDMVLVFLPGISCIVICICINVIRLTHPFDYSHKHANTVIGVWMLRALCIGVMFGVLFTWKFLNHMVILGVYVFAFLIQILVDFEAKQRLLEEEHGEERESMKIYKESLDSRDHREHQDHDNDQHATKRNEQRDIARMVSRRVSLVGAF